ncbi:MAG: carotenoid biosynthesis protein [Spirochaetes bacterium]|nr:carotenoid biosynthesis protein [Spirochaetota bacterium]
MEITLSKLIIEFLTYVLFALTLYHEATRENSRQLLATTAGVLIFCYVVDYLFTHSGGSTYTYGQFLVMLPGGIPLWITLGWSVLFYAAMTTSDLLEGPWGIRPVVDALLVANIDWNMDPIAVALDFWTWNTAPDTNVFFDIPYRNFTGWLIIVFSFSLMVRLGYRLFRGGGSVRDILVPLAAALPAFALTYGIVYRVFHPMYAWIGETLTITAVFGAAFLAVIIFVPLFRKDHRLDCRAWMILSVPLCYHGLAMLLLYADGIYQGTRMCHWICRPGWSSPILVVYMPLCALFGMVCFIWPYLDEVLSYKIRRFTR